MSAAPGRAGRAAATAALCVAGGVAVFLLGREALRQPGRAALGEPFQYDVTAQRRVDPALIVCAEVAKIAVDLSPLRGVAVGPGGSVYVAGAQSVAVFRPDGTRIRAFALDAPANCIAVDARGTVFAGMRDHVEVFDAAGARTAVWEKCGDEAMLTSVAIATNGVYAADAGRGVVYRFDRGGRLLNRIGQKDAARGIDGFVIPSPYFDVAVGPDDALWVVDPGRHQVMHFAPDGKVISFWQRPAHGIDGFCGCCNPSHIAIRADGTFVTSEKGLPRVKIYGPAGNMIGVVAGPDSFAADARGLDLAVDAQGRIYVLDPQAGAVRVFEQTREAAGAGGAA